MQAASFAYEAVKGRKDIPVTVDNKTRPGQKMRSAQWFGKMDIRMEDADIPTITDPKDAVIKVTGTTVCGSDLHLYHGEIFELKQGDILGHEFCGIVDEVGPQCNLKVGQRVVASFQIACGSCEYCKKGLSSMCDMTNDSKLMEDMYGHRFAGLFGYSHFAGGFAGGQAEYVRIPFADVNLLPIPDDVPDEKALYLSDVLSTSYHAVVEANIQKGQVVGIWGAGPIGLLCTAWAFILGASRVIVIDNVEDRLQRAKSFWGAETINFEEQDPVTTIQEIVPGGIDAAIDCAAFRYAKTLLHKVERAVGLETDASEVPNEMIKLVKKFGYVVLIADYSGYTNHFNIGAVMEKGIRFIGGGQAPVQKYWQKILDEYIRPGLLDNAFRTVLTHRFQIEDIPQIYKRFDAKEMGIIKVFVETKFSQPADAISPPLHTPLQ
jgi:threonine dehydrogenase-like Zn-dependent dehydrogenase